VERSGVPPFLDPRRPRESFLQLYAERTPEYRKVADRVVVLDGRAAADENVGHIRAALAEE
jgi:hypothetical protein